MEERITKNGDEIDVHPIFSASTGPRGNMASRKWSEGGRQTRQNQGPRRQGIGEDTDKAAMKGAIEL